MIKNKSGQKNWEERPSNVTNKFKERTFTEYMDFSIIAIVAVLFFAIVVTFLVEIVFDPQIDWKEIGINTVLISACTVAIYLLLRFYSMRKGRKTEEWGQASERLSALGKDILKDNRARLIPSYCRQWEEERLDSDIEVILSPVGITLEEFMEKYAKYEKKELAKKFPELTQYQLKTVLRAKRIKRLKFDERYFYVNSSVGRHRSPSGGVKAKQLNQIIIARIVLTTLAFSLISASLLRDIIIDFSWTSVIKCLIKVAITLFFGAVGMIGGYNFTTTREVAEMNAKSDEIEIFLTWCEDKEKTAKT